MTIQKNVFPILQILLIIITKTTTAQTTETQLNYLAVQCTYSEPISTNTTYHANLLTAFSNLLSHSTINHFFFTSSGLGPDLVNAFYLCRPDFSLATCHACVNATIETFKNFCIGRKETIVWYQECMIRYTNNSISPSGNQTEPWSFVYSTLNVSESNFPMLVNTTMRELISEAVSVEHTPRFFAYGKANFTAFVGLYGMVFCRPDFAPEDCEICLTLALGMMSSCCGNGLSFRTAILLPNCQLRYDTAPFIFPSP
ncbi:cysteine-rich receptor-like protein kinase 25 [Amaranthus tricolor]|uniref:cysteine-rich receptor-like protein kinase 25 n=1 Tax=Amaranthus tricolor TaxID=29722 RepID=UPI00258771BB|nr:cysteine-rich receptor-like protein kinase 25 [Amaranthus tricolor]